MNYCLLLMAAIGVTVTMIDVQSGPGPWIVRYWLRPALSDLIGLEPATKLLTCGVCFSAYTGLLVGLLYGCTGDWLPAATLPFAAPCGFWLVLRLVSALGAHHGEKGR